MSVVDPASSPPRPPTGWGGSLAVLGPGLVIAATGVGAGDLVTAAVAGSEYGYALAWAAVAGAVLKLALNEGLARWQLATGTTLIEGWVTHLGRWVQYVFLGYLIVWSFIVGGALISACGIAGHALVPAVPYEVWGALHSLLAAAWVLRGRYAAFERTIAWLVALMFVTLVGCAVAVRPPWQTLAEVARQADVPPGSTAYLLGVVGGVGGSVTLLSYGYWIREKRWEGAAWLRTVRLDLCVAYGLTGLFGVAVLVLSATVLHRSGTPIEGAAGAVRMAEMLGGVIGDAGRLTFMLGFWAAVATSMLGVWQGVPYLFCDFVGLLRALPPDARRAMIDTRSRWYRGFLAWLSLPPLILLYARSPVAVVVLYSVTGALFMPFLAGTLLYMNARRRWLGRLRSGVIAQSVLLICLALFAALGYRELREALDKLLGS